MPTVFRPYANKGKMYIIFGSELVKRLSFSGADLFEMRRSEAGYFLKLRRKMMHTAESGLIGDLCK
jgi:hypothetical protein